MEKAKQNHGESLFGTCAKINCFYYQYIRMFVHFTLHQLKAQSCKLVVHISVKKEAFRFGRTSWHKDAVHPGAKSGQIIRSFLGSLNERTLYIKKDKTPANPNEIILLIYRLQIIVVSLTINDKIFEGG